MTVPFVENLDIKFINFLILHAPEQVVQIVIIHYHQRLIFEEAFYFHLQLAIEGMIRSALIAKFKNTHTAAIQLIQQHIKNNFTPFRGDMLENLEAKYEIEFIAHPGKRVVRQRK